MNINELTQSYLAFWGDDEIVSALFLARLHLMQASVMIAVLRLENENKRKQIRDLAESARATWRTQEQLRGSILEIARIAHIIGSS